MNIFIFDRDYDYGASLFCKEIDEAGDQDDKFVRYEETQSQLAALREELAKVASERDKLRNGLESDMAEIDRIQSVHDAKFVQCRKLRVSLADAERRNSVHLKMIAGLVEYADGLLADVNNAWRYAGSTGDPEVHEDQDYAEAVALIAALNPNPEAASHDE